jgi:hypothetical protein
MEYQYSTMTADGTTINFTPPADAPPVVELPQHRVFSREYGVRLPQKVTLSSSAAYWPAEVSPSRAR